MATAEDLRLSDAFAGLRVASVSQVSGSCARDFVHHRIIRRVFREIGQPLIHFGDGESVHRIADSIASGDEQDFVAESAVGLLQARAQSKREKFEMVIAADFQVAAWDLTPDVDNGNLRKTDATAGHAAGLVGSAKCHGIRDGASRDKIVVVVEAADVLIQIEKLGDGNRAGVESGQAVLDSGVINRAAGEAGSGIAAINVDGVVVCVATNSGAIRLRVIAQRFGDLSGAKDDGIDAVAFPCAFFEARNLGVAADGLLSVQE